MAEKIEQEWTRISSSESARLYGSWYLDYSAWRYDNEMLINLYILYHVCIYSTVIPGLYSAPINRPHLLIFNRKKKLYINKPRLSISRRCPCDCGQASRHSRLCGQISRHGNSTAPIILTFTVNTSKPPRMGRWGQESSVRGTTSGFQSLFRLRSQCHVPPEANPPLSLRCPHHGGFTPDAEAPCCAVLRYAELYVWSRSGMTDYTAL